LEKVLLAKHLRPNSRVNLIGISIALKAGMSGAPQKNPRTGIAVRGPQANNLRKRPWTIFLAAISAAICLSSGAFSEGRFTQSSWGNTAYPEYHRVQSATDELHGQFQDCTEEIVGRALALIDRNEREGAALEQRWYAFRRFGENPEQILKTREVRFYGGREADVLRAIASQYVSLDPIVPDQDPSEIRLFVGRRHANSSDLVIIGQNGREVALKTVIRLAYLFKFMDDKNKRDFVGFDSFLRKVKVYLSSISAHQEFISFFHQYQITDPDVVMIGFQRDARAVLTQAGIGEPERYSSDSLRVNWYPNANGKKILLVSINGNRIFASRAGELMDAMLETFRSPPRTIVFFGSAGAIDSAQLVGQIVAPTVVGLHEYFPPGRHHATLAHIIRNHAATVVPLKTAHVSVDSIVVETSKWAATNSQRKIMTVDQELFHVINVFNASPLASQIEVFVGLLVTDNVSTTLGSSETTFQCAEDVIARTGAVRRQFFTNILDQAGIIPQRYLVTRSKIL
jgi:hypothetical protein